MGVEDCKQKFFDENTDFHEIQNNSESFSVGDVQNIDEIDDEVWLMQCPKGVDLTELEGEKLKLPGRSTIGGPDLELLSVEFSAPQKHGFGYCTRKGRYALKLLPVCGSIVVRKRLQANAHLTTEQIEEVGESKSLIPKVPVIKVRHPLLGAVFEEKLTVPQEIANRLREADALSTRVMLEAKQRKQLRPRKQQRASGEQCQIIIESDDDDDDDEVEFVSEIQTKGKKKKRKHSAKGDKTANIEKVQSPAKRPKISEQIQDVSEDLQWLKEL